MKKELRGMILYDEMLNCIPMMEGEVYLGKCVVQSRRFLTSESKRTGLVGIFTVLLLSNRSSF